MISVLRSTPWNIAMPPDEVTLALPAELLPGGM
jgi:hypothetical protein